MMLQVYLESRLATANERATELNRENLRVLPGLLQRYGYQGHPFERTTAAFELNVARRAGGLLAAEREVIRKYILPPSEGGEVASWDKRFEMADSGFPPIRQAFATLTDEDRAYVDYLKELTLDRDPLVQFFAGCELARFAEAPLASDPRLDRQAIQQAVVKTWQEHSSDWEQLSVENRARLTCIVSIALQV